MSASTQPKTFSDLYTLLRTKLRNASSTAGDAECKGAINTALYDMHIGWGERFPWAERSARLTTQPAYSTGTVTITQGSTTLTGASTLWTTTNSFGVANVRSTGKIVINGTHPVYEISSVDGAGTITLASRYVGDNVSDGTYSYYEDEYDLHADFLRPMSWRSFDDNASISIIDRQRFRSQYVRVNVTGKPVVACVVDRAPSGNTTPIRRVQFWKPPDQAYSIPYHFVTNKLATDSTGTALESMSSDTDEPIVPAMYRHAIVLHALYNWYRDKKDDTRSQEAKAEYTDLLLRISGDTEIGENRPRFQAAMSGYRSNARAPYGMGRGGRHTIGTRFDGMKDW